MIRLAFLGVAASCVLSSSALAQGTPLQLGQKPGAPANNAISRAAPPASVATPDAANAIQRANAYLNSVTTLVSDFVQTGADGRVIGGKLYIQKPGRLRFEYDRPSPLEIIADGTSVAVRNRRLNTQDVYFIGQTPLKFLLKPTIDLARDVKILEVTGDTETTTIRVEDRATLGGTSRISLIFRNKDFALVRWLINDAQGGSTMIALNNMDTQKRPDPALFRINYERQD